MPDPLVTLTTDFGETSPYVAALKGALLAVCPAARPVDLSHLIPPQDVWHGAFFLAEAVPYFPPGTLHVVVVDPGVGTDRALLYAEAAGQRLLLPDNGLLTLLDRVHPVGGLRRLTEPRFWRPTVSATFHGRDILAPAAGHLAAGADPADLGPAVTEWQRLAVPEAREEEGGWRGEVLFVDHFGNLLTNLPPAALAEARFRVRVDEGPELTARRVRTYGDARPGELVALTASGGWWELAVVQGSAARLLSAGRGAPVAVRAG
jgi:S-adenosylmethionine hydrolase